MTEENDDYIRLLQAQMDELRDAGAASGRASMLHLERVMCDKFRMLREERGWSQKELAEKVRDYGFDFHQSTIAKLESGARPLRVAEMYALSHVFRMPPGAVFFMAYSTSEDDGLDPFDSLTRLLAREEEGRAEMRTMMLDQMAQTVDIIADYQTRMNSIVDAMRRVAATNPNLADVIAEINAKHPRRSENRQPTPDLLEAEAAATKLIKGRWPDGERQAED
ncbi:MULTISPECIES: helix-turn-helix transcriptional regulator [unclassified Microbacterium]|uniref:helix-turn-helix transcriptional regulator n=1 Tax=unclassified Microbacterium TaxID=2609290 RepID=UPI000EA8EBB7|nr:MULTISPECIES: helix-turn-helix transcriptional regulator [unclassified Microbacterium]MBT2483364.1 helix-turn-helix transcriptional regulator [Microbacterium sp. ISL-108]RKN66396.1 XRE family transcriptional regulator [Microbacterium sp. CGR2]